MSRSSNARWGIVLSFVVAACSADPTAPPRARPVEAARAIAPGTITSVVVDSVIALDSAPDSSVAYEIANTGWIVGMKRVAGSRRAMLWKGVPASVIPATVLPLGPGWTGASASGINDNGLIIGNGEPHTYAFTWTQAGGLTVLNASQFTGTDGLPGTGIALRDVNTSGNLVGSIQTPTAGLHALSIGTLVSYVWKPCGYRGALGAINDNGWYGGQVATPQVVTGFVWNGACQVGSTPGSLAALNANGIGAGTVSAPGVGDRAARWTSAGGFVAVQPSTDTRATTGQGINTAGWIVGGVGLSGQEQPFLWHSRTGIVLLPDLRTASCMPGTPLRGIAYDVNDSGWVVGRASDCAGQSHATLWKVRVVTTTLGPSAP